MTATQTTLENLRTEMTLSRQDIETFAGKANWPMSKITRVERGTGSTTAQEQEELRGMMIELATKKADAIQTALKASKTWKATAPREEAKKVEETPSAKVTQIKKAVTAKGATPTKAQDKKLTELAETVAAMKK